MEELDTPSLLALRPLHRGRIVSSDDEIFTQLKYAKKEFAGGRRWQGRHERAWAQEEGPLRLSAIE